MGFFNWIGSKLGAGKALHEEVQKEARRAELAAKELLKIAQHAEGTVIKLSKVRKPLTSLDLLDQSKRRKVEALTDEYRSARKVAEIEAKISELFVTYGAAMYDTMMSLRIENQLSTASTEAEVKQMVSAIRKEREELLKIMETQVLHKLDKKLRKAHEMMEKRLDKVFDEAGL